MSLNQFRGGVRKFVRSVQGSTFVEHLTYSWLVSSLALVCFIKIAMRPVDVNGEQFAASVSNKTSVEFPVASVSNRVSHWFATVSMNESAVVITTLLAVIVLLLGILCQRLARSRARHRLQKLNAETEKTNQVFEKRQRILRVLSNDVEALLEGRLVVRHLMTKDPLMVLPSDNLETAYAMMNRSQLDYLVVCDRNEEPVGLLSNYFLRKSQDPRLHWRNHYPGSNRSLRNVKGTLVRKLMLKAPPVVDVDTPLSATITRMVNQGLACLVVLEGRRVVGMLTSVDIQITLQCALQLLYRTRRNDQVASLTELSSDS